MLGYSSKEYASVYSIHGEIFKQDINSRCILIRPIRGTDLCDAASIYPFAVISGIHGWNDIEDLEGLYGKDLVSFTQITDPLHRTAASKSAEVSVYKDHAIVIIDKYDVSKLPENHRRNIKKFPGHVQMKCVIKPKIDAIICHGLYTNLVQRHNITGITNYSLDQFISLLSVPGVALFYVFIQDHIEAFAIFFLHSNNAYYHCSGQTDVGYKNNSMFGLMHSAITCFKQLGLSRLELGGKADGTTGEGLWRFKSGFADNIKQNYIHKYILDKEKYFLLSGGIEREFFPAYRHQEVAVI